MGDRRAAAEVEWREARRELDQAEAAYRTHGAKYIGIITEGSPVTNPEPYTIESIEETNIITKVLDKARAAERESWWNWHRASHEDHIEATEAGRANELPEGD